MKDQPGTFVTDDGRTLYDVGGPHHSPKDASDFYSQGEPQEHTLTQQQFKDEVDINTIVRRFGLTQAQVAEFGPQGVYGDFSGITDFQSALQRVRAAEEGFLALPPELRAEFHNNPGEFVHYVASLSPRDWDAIKEPPPPPPPPAPPAQP